MPLFEGAQGEGGSGVAWIGLGRGKLLYVVDAVLCVGDGFELSWGVREGI